MGKDTHRLLRALAPEPAKRTGSAAQTADSSSANDTPTGPMKAREGQINPDKALVSGIGGQTFTTNAPPGSGRITRLPFYPCNPANSLTGGILDEGDDPILAITLANNTQNTAQVTSYGYAMETAKWDSGKYRVLGIVTNFQESYASTDANADNKVNSIVKNVGIAVANLQVYNGAQLFVVPSAKFIDASTFRVIPGGDAYGDAANNYMRTLPLTHNNRGRQFIGLRDYPVIERNTTLTIDVQAFCDALQPRAEITVPITISLIVDILEDRVFGDVPVPSPASRGGAVVKVGLERVAGRGGGFPPNKEILKASRYVPPMPRFRR